VVQAEVQRKAANDYVMMEDRFREAISILAECMSHLQMNVESVRI
jgi:hypothetical protein